MIPAAGELGRNQILVCAQIEQVELVDTALVADVGQVMAVARNRQFLDVPGNAAGDHGLLAGEEIDVAQLRELAVAVRNQVHALAVAGEFGARDPDLGRRRVHLALLSRVKIDHVQIGLGDRHVLQNQELAVVRRPIERIPGGAVAR